MTGLTGLHHIAILCTEEARSVRFYSDLGFSVRSRHPRSERGDVIVHMEGCGITLELFIAPGHPPRPTDPEAYGLRHLALRAAPGTMDALYAALVGAGYRPEAIRLDSFTGEPMLFVKDPDGLPIELHE